MTLCSHNKECLLGDVASGNMHLNEFGKVIEKEWVRTFDMRKNLVLDEYVVMPNHFHGIIIISKGRGTLQCAPTYEKFGKPTSNSIPTIIRLFKSATTSQINQLRGTPGMSLWQRNDYEHIIRNEEELNQVREYIVMNPLEWQFDRENAGSDGITQGFSTGTLQCAPISGHWSLLEEKVYGGKAK